jgi:glycine/D-amino acid oxidase-like deaminating enzyme
VKVIVVGGGINGVTSAIALKNRGHEVELIDPGPIPHPLAASTDISKAVRGAYGSDSLYTEMAARALPLWRQWNERFEKELFHEVGFLFMSENELGPDSFESQSIKVLGTADRPVQHITASELRDRYPAWNADIYVDGFLELEAGYVNSGAVTAELASFAAKSGVKLRTDCRFIELDEQGGRVRGAETSAGRIRADAVVCAAGGWTPYLLPFTRGFLRATGHPVFHLKPRNSEMFRPECFPVFGADISTTGYYGFPLNADGVVKIGNHGRGREMSPDAAERVVTAEQISEMREFTARVFPSLADAPLVYTRLCMYCDTNDGDFWIASDPDRAGLTIATGDNGHGFKFAPLLGDLIADAVEEKQNSWLERFRWRPEIEPGDRKEAARALE